MYVRRNIKSSVILKFAWKNLIIFTVYAALVTTAYVYLSSKSIYIGIPFLPVSTMGIAVAFYLGFKNSQSYDRFWEARKAWGGITNQSRVWGSQIVSYLKYDTKGNLPAQDKINEAGKILIHRQIAWINALGIQLRKTTIHDRKNISYVPVFDLGNETLTLDAISSCVDDADYREVIDKANSAAQLLRLQTLHLQELNNSGMLTEFKQLDMMQTITELYNFQGVCERIKNTPFPRQYAYMSTIFVWIFLIILPFGLVEQFNVQKTSCMIWLNIPFAVLISWVFSTMEIVGDNSEDPFENYVNDVPITAIGRNIEIDLREMLGETNIPPRIQPVGDVLL
jgi:putative membrane protein